MPTQAVNNIDESKDELFERALKQISVQAFDALLTCGVRNLNGLLQLTSEDMRKDGLSKHIISELLSIPLRFNKNATESDGQNSVIYQNDISTQATMQEQKELSRELESCPLDLELGTPIPNELIARLPTRARNVLFREKVLTIERLLEFQEVDLHKIASIGRKTVYDIRQLQNKVADLTEHTIQTSAKMDTQPKKPICNNRPNFFQRVRCHPRASEHWLSDPKDWSLLSRTLPELFWVTLPSLNDSDYDEDVTIGDLGISATDICKFREITLFQEDAADLLFSLSLGRLLQVSISDDAFLKLLDYIERFTGQRSQSQKFASTAKVSDTPIFADIKTNLIAAFRIPSLLNQDLLNIFYESKSSKTWGDIAKISERTVIRHFGFTLQGLKAIRHIWLLKEHALKFINRILTGLPSESYRSFSSLVDSFVRTVIKKAYHYPVLMGRLGFLDERKWTLEELGQRLKLTRERIRQIEKKFMPALETPRVLERLNLFWYAVDEALEAGGGICCVSEIADLLKISLKWSTPPTEESLASLISLSAKYEVVWVDPIRIIMPKYECVNCEIIGPCLIKAVENQSSGTLLFEDAIAIMREFCQSQKCRKTPDLLKFSEGFLRYLDDEIDEIFADGTTLYTQYAWTQKYGNQRLLLVENILRNASRPMHFTEVHAEINKDRPPHGQLSERNIYGRIAYSHELLLWDRGTYIHRDHVIVPLDLIKKIENEIVSRLDGTIPYISVSGIFELFKEDLLKKNIPSESALYTCLRESNNNVLSCPDYPTIVKKGDLAPRLPVPFVLEAFVLTQEGSVTYEEVRKYALKTLCVNEAIFLTSHFPNIPNLLRMNRGEYIHLSQLSIEADRLLPIVDHLKTLLTLSNHVSALKLYNDKKITCRLIGVSTPILLFSLIQFFYSDQFNLSRYPKICLAGHNEAGNRTTGVTSEVIRYITEKGTPCSYAELYQHFVDKLGYEQLSVYNVHFNSQVIRYSESVIVHLESLGWSKDRQTTLEMLVTNHLHNRKSAGKPYGLIAHLYEYNLDKLPELPNQISWTPTLIGELLCREGRFRSIGTQRNAFLSVPNTYRIETLDDLLHYILNTEYDGAANIDHFISDMREAGILKRKLTSMMLGEESRVVIEGNVVKLAGLSGHAERT